MMINIIVNITVFISSGNGAQKHKKRFANSITGFVNNQKRLTLKMIIGIELD